MKNTTDFKQKGSNKVLRRSAEDRLTMVVGDENGEFKSSEESFTGWLQRPYSASVQDQVAKDLACQILYNCRMYWKCSKSVIRVKDDIRFVLVQMFSPRQTRKTVPKVSYRCRF